MSAGIIISNRGIIDIRIPVIPLHPARDDGIRLRKTGNIRVSRAGRVPAEYFSRVGSIPGAEYSSINRHYYLDLPSSIYEGGGFNIMYSSQKNIKRKAKNKIQMRLGKKISTAIAPKVAERENNMARNFAASFVRTKLFDSLIGLTIATKPRYVVAMHSKPISI